jgi:hypothetical protein
LSRYLERGTHNRHEYHKYCLNPTLGIFPLDIHYISFRFAQTLYYNIINPSGS